MLEHIDELRDLADGRLVAVFLYLFLALQLLLVLEVLEPLVDSREDGGEFVVEVALLLLQRVPLFNQGIRFWQGWQNLGESQRVLLQLCLSVQNFQLFQLIFAAFSQPHKGFALIFFLDLDGKILNCLDN